ncbi:MAG: hypothetical protein HY846_03595 [Nitrosomonadales bacterium]|nr:hypothetical protein [Nitrosomonadales bacterium]
MSHNKTAIPDDLLQFSQQVEEWRSSHPPRSRLPETLWATATEMAQRHGLHRAAKVLRLDYMRLKKRRPTGAQPRTTSPPAFLEWLAGPAGQPECVVELESSHGKMRVAMKGMALDWAGLLQAWREAGV